jgi:hypothetical protein
MNSLRRLFAQIALVLSAALLAACGTPTVHQNEKFAQQSPYFRHYGQAEGVACVAARRALLSQGYRIDMTMDLNLKAHKDFQPDTDVNVVIDFHVTSTAKPGGSGSTVYVNAEESTYNLKKTSGAASLSVPGGGIAMPWGKTTDHLIKVAGKTIVDEQFYKRFFDLLASQLGK